MKYGTQVEETVQKLMEATADALVILDQKGVIRRLSPAAENLFGVDTEDCVNTHFSALLAPDHQRGAIDKFLALLERDRPCHGVGYEVTARTRQQKEFPMTVEIGETRILSERWLVCVCRDRSAERDAAEHRRSAENLNRVLSEAAVDGIITIDSQGRIRTFNRAAERMFGFDRSSVLGHNVSVLMPDHYARQHDSYLANYLRTGAARIIGTARDVMGQRRNGSRFPLHLSVGQARHRDDYRFIGICHDLSDYHEALRKLSRAEKRYKDIVHNPAQMICRVDPELKITFANRSLLECLGRSHRELIGTPLHQFVVDNDTSIQGRLSQLFTSTGARHFTMTLTMAAPHQNPQVEWTFTRLDNDHEPGGELQGFGVDISEMIQARREAEYFKNYDTITGLYNKPAFLKILEGWAATESCFAMIHIDLDNFGLVTHKHGFEGGNLVLSEVAQRLRTMAGKQSLVARTGADEFAVATPVRRLQEIEDLTRKVSREIGQRLPVDGQELSLDLAIGVAFYPGDCQDIQRIPDLAEAAMRDARAKREPIALFDKQSHNQLRRRLDIDQALKLAIANNVPHLVLQPKYALPSRRVAGFEALVRWHDPQLGTISPAEFIPLVEHSKLGQRLDRYVIGKALEAVRLLIDNSGTPLPVAVNITPPHFSNPDLADYVLDQLARSGISPKLLSIELTEGVFLNPSKTVANNLATLRAAGVSIAIDDFGTGYSSLSYLKQLQVDELKIDKSFTAELESDTGKTVLRAVSLMARGFGLLVTAEGVETERQLAILEQMDCDLAQGFVMSRPVPVQEACRLVRHRALL